MTTLESIAATGSAPLAATRRYSFRRSAPSEAPARLLIPVVYRSSADDFGEVERTEQNAFVEALLAELGVSFRAGYPGEWLFPDVTALDATWNALLERLGEPSAAPPRFAASREVSPAEAAAVAAGVTTRFLELVSRVAGLSGDDFACIDRRFDSSGPENTRTEVWRRGEVYVRVEATAIESGYGVHGERGTLSVSGVLGDGRDVQASTRVDMRSGGHVGVTVSGVLDAKALAERFLASL